MIMQYVEFGIDISCFLIYVNIIINGWFMTTSPMGDDLILTAFLGLLVAVFVMAILVEYKGRSDLNQYIFLLTIIKLVIVVLFYLLFGTLYFFQQPPYDETIIKAKLPGIFYFFSLLSVADIVFMAIVIYLMAKNK